MQTRILAITLCLIMASAFTVTSAVSAATQTGTSDERQYDVKWLYTGEVIGKLTVNLATGYYIIDVNYGKADVKETLKDTARQNPPLVDTQHAVLIDGNSGVTIYDVGALTKGGTLHGEGYLTDKQVDGLPQGMDILTWLKLYGDDAFFWPSYLFVS